MLINLSDNLFTAYSASNSPKNFARITSSGAWFDAASVSIPGKYAVSNCIRLQRTIGGNPLLMRTGSSVTSQAVLPGYVMYNPSGIALNPSAISAAKIEALSKLERYRLEWLSARENTINFILTNYRLHVVQRTAGDYQRLVGIGSGPPVYEYYNGGVSVEQRFTVPLRSDVAYALDALTEPSWITKQLQIEAHYGNLMDLAQNAVIQQIINTDPRISWVGNLVLDVDFDTLMREIVNEFWVGAEFSRVNPYSLLNVRLKEIEFIERYPEILDSDDLFIQLIDVKLQWLKGMIAEINALGDTLTAEQGENAELVRWIVEYVEKRIVHMMRSFMQSSPHWTKLSALLSVDGSELASLLLVQDDEFDPDFSGKTRASAEELLEAAQLGVNADRPTIILTPPGCDQEFTDWKYVHFMQLKEAQAVASVTGKSGVLEEAAADLIFPVIKNALSGRVMVGHVGSGALQSLVVSAKAYGCNVVFHQPTLQQIVSGLTLTRQKRQPLFLPNNLSDYRINDIAVCSKYWFHLTRLADEEIGRTQFRPDQQDIEFLKDDAGNMSSTFKGFRVCRASSQDIHALMKAHISNGV